MGTITQRKSETTATGATPAVQQASSAKSMARGASFAEGEAMLTPRVQMKQVVQRHGEHGHDHGGGGGAPDIIPGPAQRVQGEDAGAGDVAGVATDATATPTTPTTPAATTPAPVIPAARQMTNAAAQQILTEAFGTVKVIVPGSIQVLDQAGFQAAYDAIYGTGPYAWATYVVPRFGNLNGFAANNTNYINRAIAGLHTIVHEMLHNNTAADWTTTVGSEFNEGTTEWMTQRACARLSPPEPAPTCYPGQTPCVQQALSTGLSDGDLMSAYLTGGAPTKIAAWADANCAENWNAIKGYMQAQNWASARAGLQRRAPGAGAAATAAAGAVGAAAGGAVSAAGAAATTP